VAVEAVEGPEEEDREEEAFLVVGARLSVLEVVPFHVLLVHFTVVKPITGTHIYI
jgi:hypothetical protein